jgi:L-2-hydroxyglutarate oxidase LhgO
MEQFDFILVGGGIVGAAVSYKISKAYPEAKVVLIEKESGLAQDPSRRAPASTAMPRCSTLPATTE